MRPRALVLSGVLLLAAVARPARADALAGVYRDVAFDFERARASGPSGGDLQLLSTATGFRCARAAAAP